MTVLGKSPALPDAGGANSGYLIRHSGFTLLLECGSGVFAKLRQLSDPDEVDAVLISHLHADHTLDLYPFSHALTYHGDGEGGRPLLWAPPGSERAFATLGAVFGVERQVSGAFALAEYEPSRELALGPFIVSFTEVPHYVPAWACDIRCEDGRRFTFGADCGPNDAIVQLAQDTDLLMLEATEGPGPQPAAGFRGHLTAGEAGELGRLASAKRLLLTHYSDELDADELRQAAEEAFGARVEMAAEGARFAV
ncbi:MAG TPA: MBL fold metallo-hydrolase [Solirubrobacteraceae bacterium]|jgi:ribonuclease BN (tRNA processing enzyme)|nr:MBL fold metallo-hydrolase [Solirubrobacteraceae bacterium]